MYIQAAIINKSWQWATVIPCLMHRQFFHKSQQNSTSHQCFNASLGPFSGLHTMNPPDNYMRTEIIFLYGLTITANTASDLKQSPYIFLVW